MRFSRKDISALLTIAANIGLLAVAIPCFFTSENGWVVSLFASLCWFGGYNTHDDVVPFIRKLYARFRKDSTT